MARPRSVALDRPDREWALALGAEVERFDGKMESVYPLVLTELKARLGLDAVLCYGVSTSGDSVRLEFAHDVSFRGGGRQILLRHLDGKARPKWGYYDPLRPEPAQRNRVLSVRDMLAPKRPMGTDITAAAREAGVLEKDQVRVLLCDGPALLAWIGGFRDETVTARERAIFASIVPSLQKRALLEKRLQRSALRDCALTPVLEALTCAAMIVTPGGAVAVTNAAGKALLDHDGAAWRERLRQATSGVAIPGIEVTPFPVAGGGLHILLLVRPSVHADASVRARLLAERWGLTARHSEVLEQLAWGDSNKSIADRIGCAPRTVEIHISAMLERAQVGSRAELIARFWTAPIQG